MGRKTINLGKTVKELCEQEPEIAVILAEVGFKDITRPGMIATAGRFMTIPKGAAMKKIDLETVKQAFVDHGYEVEE